jgi:hypothetical protein
MRRTCLFAITFCSLLAATGCGEKKPSATDPIETRKTAGQTTQNVLELREAIAAGAVPVAMSASSADLSATADAYRVSMGKLGTLSVEHKLKLYQAEHGSVPETYAEFMEKIIEPGKPTGLRLPMLPYYQEYAYDADQKVLVVVEFPEKKKQREQETTGAAGL